MIRIAIDSNVIGHALAIEAARREVRRMRDLNRERTFIFSEGANGQRDAGVRGDSKAEELADAAAEHKAALKAMAAAERAG